MSEISPTPPEQQPSKKDRAIRLGKQALHLYRNRPTTGEIMIWTFARALPIIIGGTVVVSVVDVSFDVDLAQKMSQIQTNPNAHPLIQIAQEFGRAIGEEAVPFEKELDEVKREIIADFSSE